MTRMQRSLILMFLVLGLALCSMAFTGKAMAAGSLSQGAQGSAVTKVQQVLNNRGYWCGSADGVFGASTRKAVVRFQQDNGISTTGTVGPLTNKALGISTTSVSRGGSMGGSRTMSMVATGYDNSYKSNYPFFGQPSFIGLPLARGIIATDPDVIPMGTRLYVEGYGEAIAADQGNAIQGNRIDLFFDSHGEAMNWGMRTVNVTLM
ncbi:MAG TPA: 3D domain-containing protein [Syntrophomonadaceae bacterium]|nr:3D domain-containing protein [Syntrophomonadaceae bacterium]